ncbi:hypothetical protein [Marinomonas colpomeniae]|uniref:RDD family protein n=1 Tax=Marinomonas colpomeniae TaxID=2774408 RepID=A0ABR8NYN3_9GAMM|nr:hypothetical protein [Marinomonas colpomeniae]MBD5770192.1 hypothetical protein [Marinomonas colpomeniae]
MEILNENIETNRVTAKPKSVTRRYFLDGRLTSLIDFALSQMTDFVSMIYIFLIKRAGFNGNQNVFNMVKKILAGMLFFNLSILCPFTHFK